MQALFDRLAAVPLAAKIGAMLGLVVLLGGGYYYFLYSDIVDEQGQLLSERGKLEQEKKEYEKRKAEYLAFRNEVNALLEEQKELLRMLPKADDIEHLTLAPAGTDSSPSAVANHLKANFVASTFQFLERRSGGSKKANTTITAGGGGK